MSAPTKDLNEEQLDVLLRAFETALQEEQLDEARAVLAKLHEALGDDDADYAYANAHLTWLDEGPDAAEPLLERVIELDPAHAEAHYDLGCIAEENDDPETMVEHFLRVRELDAADDKELGVVSSKDFDVIENVARDVIDGLPEPFASKLANVPVIIELRPDQSLVEEGFDPRAFGLFDGPTEGVTDVPAPTRIVIYACNLLSECADPEELQEQVEITVLHEIGHYFGLEEEDMERLGLD